MLVEAASDWDLSQRLPVKRELTKVPREWHGRNRRSFMAGRMSNQSDNLPRPGLGALVHAGAVAGLVRSPLVTSSSSLHRPWHRCAFSEWARSLGKLALRYERFDEPGQENLG